MLKVLENKLI